MTEHAERAAEVIRLLSAQEADRLSDEGFARLDFLLREHPDARQTLMEYIAVDEDLRELPLEQLSEQPIGDAPLQRSGSIAKRAGSPSRWVVGLLAVAAGLGVVQFFAPGDESPRTDTLGSSASEAVPVALHYVATLRSGDEAVWATKSSANLEPGSRLLPGKYRLESGSAQIKFDSGASLAVTGPASLAIVGADAARVESGRAVFRSDGAALRFTLMTPSSRLMHFGTEYAVCVDGGEEELHVLEGEVHRLIDGAVTDRLFTGEARRFRAGQSEPAPLAEELFDGAFETDRSVSSRDESLLISESFDYADSRLLRIGQADGGTGWAGPWSLADGQPFEQSGFRADSDGAPDDWGGHCRSDSRMVAIRRLREPIRMDQDGLTYASFRFRYLEADTRSPGVHGEVLLVLRQLPANDTPFYKDGVRLLAHYDYALVSRRNDVSRQTRPLRTDQDHLFIAKIVRGADRPDQILGAVYESDAVPAGDEPASWPLVSPSFFSDEHLERLTLHTHTDGQPVLIDDLRFGSSWQSVVARSVTEP